MYNLWTIMGNYTQEKVREELDAIFASDDNTKGNYPITETHCNKMRYLECCIKETLRLFPPVSCITRRVGSDIYLGKDKYFCTILPFHTFKSINANNYFRNYCYLDNFGHVRRWGTCSNWYRSRDLDIFRSSQSIRLSRSKYF